MIKKDINNSLVDLNKEYIQLYYSPEYRLGRKMLIIKYYLKKFKVVTLIKKIYHSKMKSKNAVKNNFNNDKIFSNNEKYRENKYKGEKIAVYSVNIGGYDSILQPIYKDDKIDYYYISDKKPSDLGVWKYIDANKYIKQQGLTNVKKARYLKIHPDLFFKDYKYSIFVDGNIRVVGDISYLVNFINKETKIATHAHPYRDCIYDEAVRCKKSGKGNPKVIDKQMNEYMKEGMPKGFGLFETNVVVREHNNPTCKKIMKLWWNEIESKSERDQLSLTYSLWKNGFSANDVGVLGWDTKQNPYLQVLDHKDEYKK